jgi:hypothetical protein
MLWLRDVVFSTLKGPSWSWSYGCWIYNYICNQCLSPLKLCELESRSWRGVLDTTSCGKVCQWLPTGRWFSPGTPVSSTNNTELHDITEIWLKVALNTITQTIFSAIITQDKQFGIPLTPPHFGVCPKSGPRLPTSYVVIFAMFNELRWEVHACSFYWYFWLVDNHCLHFLFIILVSISTDLP